MLKLYKRIDGVLHYHEAWRDAGTVTEHWGMVGEQGESREHRVSKSALYFSDGTPAPLQRLRY